ncbi:ImmA/IrrE family metallo-endopeptidase [Lentilactobacillus sp. SPB1-3]|uniref:ImmA/IrrE family metallo-endopeptidase n=1 Tax=Lentilactobacillus terminaliae TaxID=3003483 RepID=A0ACD5DDD0_9LACO|nr:ImmA/IrrE family metallo-endopeptidase [Lentilactobacillus sp. SPB1-3]MCZ0978141.1 ImmA/IrrE family metallo-endopeptidase [Lentilactobacillus sp. SPB1-3]
MNDRQLKKLISFLGQRYGTFDPFTIAEKLNIDVQYRPFSKKPLGDTINFFGRPIILLAESLKESNQRYFVCAHELGHAIEHANMQAYYVSNDFAKTHYEVQADKFAVSLLGQLYVEENGHIPDNWMDLVHEYGYPSL